MSDDAPDPQRLIRLARQTLSAAERRRSISRSIILGSITGTRHSSRFSPPAAAVCISA
jgi:hypothetical protein